MNFGGKCLFYVPKQRDLHLIRVFAVLISQNTVGSCWMLTLFSLCWAWRGCQPGAIAVTSLPGVALSRTRHRRGAGPPGRTRLGPGGVGAKPPTLGTTARGRGPPAGSGSARAGTGGSRRREVLAGTAGSAMPGPGPRPAPCIRPGAMQGGGSTAYGVCAVLGAGGSYSRSASPSG